MDRFAKYLFVASLLFLLVAAAFGYGLAVSYLRLWPYTLVESAKNVVSSFIKYGQVVPVNRRHRAPAEAARERVTIHREDQVDGGFYVFTGWSEIDEIYVAWLYDSGGNLLHTWPISYELIDPDGPSNKSTAPHAFHVLRDGTIIVGFDKGDVMARLDECGVPIWMRDGVFHHSFEQAEDGGIWTWRSEGTSYGHYHYMEKFNPVSGKVIKSIGLVEDIIPSTPSRLNIFGVGTDYEFKHFNVDPPEWLNYDIFHPNDLEELPSAYESSFPMFDAGDLMASFRALNMIVVIDPDDFNVKWWSRGPWLYQHDPDFTPDGRISVYSNNTFRNRSEIIQIDPATRVIFNDLHDGEFSFYSKYRGKHQILPSGNVLIVIPEEGRVVSVTSSGDLVLEFNNVSPFGVEYNEDVENALWVGREYFTTVPSC